MIVYNKAKSNIEVNLKTRLDYFDYIQANEFLPGVVSLDKIQKYLVDYQKLDEMLKRDDYISKDLFYKKGVRPIIKTSAIYCPGHYTTPSNLFYKGYTFDEIQEHFKNKSSKSLLLISTWTNKRKFLLHKAEEMAKKYYNDLDFKFEISTFAKTNKNYWIDRGYNEEEAVNIVKEIQSKNSKKRWDKVDKGQRKGLFNTSIEYYLRLGYTEDEAIHLRKERQRTFSLEKCIEKYGEEKGFQVWKERQKKWQDTLNSKSEEEKQTINNKKSPTIRNFIRKHGEELGIKKYNEWVISYKERLSNRGKGYSIEACEWFESFIPSEILKKSFYKEKEFFLHDGVSVYFYDFTYKKIIIEYHGYVYHCNPSVIKNIEEWKSPYGTTGYESIKKDKHKRKLAEQNGFMYFEYYSNDSKEKEIEIKQKILEALNEADQNQTIKST